MNACHSKANIVSDSVQGKKSVVGGKSFSEELLEKMSSK